MSLAPPPSKASGKLTLGFSLVTIPVSVFAGQQDSRVNRKEYVSVDGDLHKVGRQAIDKETNEPVVRDDVMTCVETVNGPVEVTDAEIEQLLQGTKGAATIEAFLPLSVLGSGRYIPHRILQVRPSHHRNGQDVVYDKGASRAFTLLMTAMRREQVFGLVRFTMRGSSSYGALLANGRLYVLLYDDQVRQDLPMPDAEITKPELEMAVEIVHQHRAETPPLLVDESAARIREYAEAKAAGLNPTPVSEPMPSVDDLMAALKASIDSSKSPRT